MTDIKSRCTTQWHIIVAYLHQQKTWIPTHKLQGVRTDFGFIGSSGEQRVRELAVNKKEVIDRYPELKDKVEKFRDGKYEYFRYRIQLTPRQHAAELCRRFDAGLPAEQVFAH